MAAAPRRATEELVADWPASKSASALGLLREMRSLQRRVSQVLGNAIGWRPGNRFLTKSQKFAPRASTKKHKKISLHFANEYSPLTPRSAPLPQGACGSFSLSLSLSLFCFLSRFGAPGNAQVGLPAPLSQGWIFFRAFVFQYIGCSPPTTLRPPALHEGKRSPQTSCKGRFVVVGACLGEGGGRWMWGGCPVCGLVVS